MKLERADQSFDDRIFIFTRGAQEEWEVAMTKPSSRGVSPGAALAAKKGAVQNDPSPAIGAKRLAMFQICVAVDATRRKDEVQESQGHKIVLQ